MSAKDKEEIRKKSEELEKLNLPEDTEELSDDLRRLLNESRALRKKHYEKINKG